MPALAFLPRAVFDLFTVSLGQIFGNLTYEILLLRNAGIFSTE
jgi:hypothetical protein